MECKNLLIVLGFSPKENAVGIFSKKYPQVDGYCIEVDVEKQTINYGDKIKTESKATLNFVQAENWVVLECVNRLLEKGYQPENIVLEKTYPAGRGVTKRLDILILQDEKPYLMIECKTYGEEFDKELNNLEKTGGQLFTYFQQDTKAELLMLYASKLGGNDIISDFRMVKIEEDFRQAGNVKNVFKLWDKKFHKKGFWENPPYDFQTTKFTKGDLKELTEEKGKKLFHGFATILRKHSVSDKPNAFNVIFNLFLAKLYDEQKGDNDELEFQWRKNDDPVDFQIRLHNLHKEGLNDFLKKEIEGIYDKDFDAKTAEERYNAKKRLLKFNKFFSIKDVFDDETFDQNHRVLKEVVQLIEKYQIRYPRKQKYLSEFFELLLTTGLKQEVGQYFTPPPIAKFIVRSLPIPAMIELEMNHPTPKLPAVMDYAAGSGHFITEIMEEYQDIIDNLDTSKYFPNAKTKAKIWSQEHGEAYSWASLYIYGIEKDYRLVKVAKVGCYFYGDGLAQIIHGDGLDSLTNPPKSYIGLLEQNTNNEDSTKNKFSIVVANPPYSVDNCKDDLEYIGAEKEFSLYKYLTYNSSEIECLFVERTKHLLKDGGVAGIILPSSILSNSNSEIHTKTREIILRNFEIIAITEFGSNTFMATPTTTIVLFLRRINNNRSISIQNYVERFFTDFQDVNPPIPCNNLEKPVAKYVNEIWDAIDIGDYVSLIKNAPNENAQNHEFYKNYRKSVEQKIKTEIAKAQKNRKTLLSEEDVEKIKDRIERESWNAFIKTEKEKLLYFILAYHQKTVIVKSGKGNNEEKQFLGYYFSKTRGKEGLFPTNGRSTIEECTKLYNEKDFEDKTKVSSYIYKAFANDNPEIDESLKNHIFRVRLVDMLTFDRSNFDKSISLNPKKKVTIDTKWEEIKFDKIADIIRGVTYAKSDQTLEKTEKIVLTADNITLEGHFELKKEIFLYDNFAVSEDKRLRKNDIFMCFSSGSKEHLGKVAFIENDTNYLAGGFMGIIRAKNEMEPKYLFQLLNSFLRQPIRDLGSGSNINNLSGVINEIKIPLPPKEIQQKIVMEIEVLEKKEAEAKGKVEELRSTIHSIINNLSDSTTIKEYFNINANTLNPTEIWENEYFTYVDIDSVGKGNGFIDFNQKILGKDAPSRARRLAKNTTAIISTVRPYLKGFAFVDFVPEKTIFSTGFALIKSKSENEYITKLIYLLFMFSNNLMKQMEAAMPKSAYPSINKEDIENFMIPVPPFSEQQNIVSEIEKIETQIAELEQQLAKIPKQKEEILKKYL